MVKLLWMTIDRHPEPLRNLIRGHLETTGWEVFEISYDSIDDLGTVPLEEIDAVFLAPARHFPRDYMNRLTNCKLMQIWSSGYDKFNISDALERKILVANNDGANAISVAEHTILMMLGIARRAPEMHRRVITGNWAGNDHGMSSFSLFGKTLGIVGLGNIGMLVAKRAEAFGMRIVFSDPSFRSSPNESWGKVEFSELLGISDFISFHVHLGQETRHMLNTENIGLMKRKPFLINVSRAELIERSALEIALESHQIRGVAIDAHYDEPTSVSDGLMAHQNIFFTPHVAGSTVDSYESAVNACIENISATMESGVTRGRLTGL